LFFYLYTYYRFLHSFPTRRSSDLIFNYITSQGTGTCASAKLGIPGANLGCSASNTCSSSSCGLTSINIAGGGYWSLGDRGYSPRSEEHTSELQSRGHLVCRLLLEK